MRYMVLMFCTVFLLAMAYPVIVIPAEGQVQDGNSTGSITTNTVPSSNGQNGISGMQTSSNADPHEHDLPNGVRYYDNGTIIEKIHGKDAKFHFNKKVIFNPGGAPPNPNTPDPVISCTPSTGISYSLSRIKCGLVESDPLNNETMTQQQLQANQKFWVYGGDAIAENAPYSFSRDTSGLHIGVQSPSQGTYAGFYAVTPDVSTTLFHATLTAPVRAIASNDSTSYFQNGLYVQTSQPMVNYVTCVSVTNTVGTIWVLVHTYGDQTQALTFDTLWVDNSPNQPLTRDCTISTNGNNYLKVYMDGVMVYTSDTLNLKMPKPFNAFLEPQTAYAGQLLSGTYTNFYEASGETVNIINAPSGAQTAKALGTSGAVLASSTVSSGSAVLNIGRYVDPVDANLVLYNASNGKIVSTPSDYNLYGGDVFSIINGTKLPLPPSGVSPTPVSFSQINLKWNAPQNNGSPVVTGYKVERSTGGSAWSTISNTAGTTYSDVGLSQNTTYSYRVSSINSAGTSATSSIVSATTLPEVKVTVNALDQYGNAMTGIWMELHLPNGTMAEGGYTPAVFNASSGLGYSVIATNFANTTFSRWDDGSVNPSRNLTPTTNVVLTAHYDTPIQYAIALTKSGLVVSDPLNNKTATEQQLLAGQKYWAYGGTASGNGTFALSQDAQGLHVGVHSQVPGNYEGYHAQSPAMGGMLFHSFVTASQRQITNSTGAEFQGGMYVENPNLVNYVTCVAITNNNGTFWSVVSAVGNATSAIRYTTLWSDQSTTQPLGRYCTIVTNGTNYLKVLLDDVPVYSSNTLGLKLKNTLNNIMSLLESESSYTGALSDSYKDFYVTAGESVKIDNLPTNSARVQLADLSGKVLASAPVISGNATINVASYHLPLAANIRVLDVYNSTLASTALPANIYGGDAYSAHLAPGP